MCVYGKGTTERYKHPQATEQAKDRERPFLLAYLNIIILVTEEMRVAPALARQVGDARGASASPAVDLDTPLRSK